MTKLVSIFMLFCFPCLSWGTTFASLKIGMAKYAGIENFGLTIGGMYGITLDEMVRIGIGIDLMKKTDASRSITSTDSLSGINIQQLDNKKVNYKHLVIPALAHLRIRLPIGGSVLPYIGGGVGVEMIQATFNDNSPNVEKAKGFYGGFGWNLAAGADWKLGSRTALLGEILYNQSSPTKDNFTIDLTGFEINLGLLVDF